MGDATVLELLRTGLEFLIVPVVAILFSISNRLAKLEGKFEVIQDQQKDKK